MYVLYVSVLTVLIDFSYDYHMDDAIGVVVDELKAVGM